MRELGARSTSSDVAARGKLVRGSIRTSVLPVAGEPARGAVVGDRRDRERAGEEPRREDPAARALDALDHRAAGRGDRHVAHRPVGAATPRAPTSTPSTGRPSAPAAGANAAEATISTAASEVDGCSRTRYARDGARGP